MKGVPMQTALVYMTAPDMEKAREIAARLVEKRLCACVNMLPGMESIYRWEGKTETAREVVLIAKTKALAVQNLVEEVRAIHPYQCPCIVSVPVTGGCQEFLDWIARETR